MWLDLAMVLGLLVLVTLWWALVSLLGLLALAPWAYTVKLTAGLPWWGRVLGLVGLALGACAPIAVVYTIQRLSGRGDPRR
jgi:hypothetical protein